LAKNAMFNTNIGEIVLKGFIVCKSIVFLCAMIKSEGHIFSPIFIIYVKIHRFLKMFSLRVRVRVMVLNVTFNNNFFVP
jgi:cellulose synthase/poly-beta-1,6-N-acetylglucosamine synthase-like glycosyltransferase